MRWVKAVLASSVLLTVTLLLNQSLGTIPPLAKFLNPFAGFWQNGSANDDFPELLDVKGLKDRV